MSTVERIRIHIIMLKTKNKEMFERRKFHLSFSLLCFALYFKVEMIVAVKLVMYLLLFHSLPKPYQGVRDNESSVRVVAF